MIIQISVRKKRINHKTITFKIKFNRESTKQLRK